MKKLLFTVPAFLIILFMTSFSLIILAPAASAKCGNIDTALISCPDGANPTLEIIKLVLKVLIGLVGVTAVGALVFAGILYSSASGDTSQVQKAKTMIQNTVIGLVLFGGMMLIGNWMIPGGMFGGSITYSGSGTGGGVTPTTGTSTGSSSTGATTTPGTTTNGGTTTNPSPAPVQNITLSGVQNFRDVATLTPSVIKPGVLYRSARLQNATSSDVTKLATILKNGAIIDLRTSSTRQQQPDKPIPGVPNISYPITGVASASGYVKEFINSQSGRTSFNHALTKIATTSGATIVHCTAGKDRTGWTVALAMYIAGASDQQVKAEYLKSKDAGSGFNVSATWLDAAISAAVKKGGSIMGFVTLPISQGGLGLSDATIAALRQKIRA